MSGEMHSSEVHIASLVVHAKPEAVAAVRRALESLPDCEVAAADDGGKLILVVETLNTRRITETIEHIQGFAGVLNTVMAYHHCEDESALNEELQNETHTS